MGRKVGLVIGFPWANETVQVDQDDAQLLIPPFESWPGKKLDLLPRLISRFVKMSNLTPRSHLQIESLFPAIKTTV